jgi:hypothetical protein
MNDVKTYGFGPGHIHSIPGKPKYDENRKSDERYFERFERQDKRFHESLQEQVTIRILERPEQTVGKMSGRRLSRREKIAVVRNEKMMTMK